VTRAQAEELPPAAVGNVPAPTAPQANPSSMSAPTAPAAVPSPQAPPSPALARDHGWVLIPYFGLNSPVAAAGRSYSDGFHLGGLAGWSLTPRFSINGEFTLDLMDGTTDSSILKPHEYYLDFVLSPLFHLWSGEIVIGPKLGWFTNSRSFSDSDSAALNAWVLANGSRVGFSGPPLSR
jgi:hypothetical protein